MIDILRDQMFDFVRWNHAKLAHQVQSVLAKLELCRTKALGGHKYRCAETCQYHCELPVYNSVSRPPLPRPLCSGGGRAKWLEKIKSLILPGVNYFQLVFTMPDKLSSFSLGNRKAMYDLLLKSAWQALDELLREKFGVAPAAALVLHTWNQELDAHTHAHALVPGSFPSLDGQQWITPKHPKHKRRKKPYLCDNFELSEKFRKKFMAGLEKLYKKGKLNFEHESSASPEAFAAWVKQLQQLDWNVYIQGPPSDKSDPEHVVKYLARYMTGGPISDSRLISYDGEEVYFWARSKNKKKQNKPRPFRLPAREFIRRWSLHIVPKGYTKSRCYGGWHNTKRADYLELCRRLLPASDGIPPDTAASPPSDDAPAAEVNIKCPRCETEMVIEVEWPRTGWGQVLDGPHRPDWYYGFMGGHGKAYQWYRNGY